MNIRLKPNILFLILGFFALTLEAFTQNDPKAVSILDASKKKFYSLTDITSSLKYSLENKSLKDGNVTKKGTIKIKGKKFRINLNGQDIICDGKAIYTILKEEKEINIQEFDPKESMSIDRIFAVYEKETKARLDKDEVLSGKTFNKITLFSNSKESEFIKIEVWINKTSTLVERARIYSRNGSTVAYEMSEIKTNSNVPDSDFVFNKASYPGMEIIDLR